MIHAVFCQLFVIIFDGLYSSMKINPAKKIAAEAIISGAFGVSSAAMYPERTGGKDCPKVLMLEFTPRVRPCSSAPTDLLMSDKKFA